MRNIKLTIAYDGTGYKGWQVQKNGRTVQEELEKAISRVFGGRHVLYGASRTDAGAHAMGQTANFKTSSGMPVSKIALALNSVIPADIAVKKAEEVRRDFHSRFDAKTKRYRYHILNSGKRDPFRERYSYRVPYALDVPLMREEAAFLAGVHNFKSFQARDKTERSSVREIKKIDIRKKGVLITIDIEGDGFLYNMVRNIAGTLIDVGRGYLPPGSMSLILDAADRTKAGPTAPAKGLFLVEVKY